MPEVLDEYTKFIDAIGLNSTWEKILARIDNSDAVASDGTTQDDTTIEGIVNSVSSDAIDTMVSLVGDLYEYGLAHVNPSLKKKLGQFYTPSDVARLMGRNLKKLFHTNDSETVFFLIEPSCGCGSLLLPALDELMNEGIDITPLIRERLIICDIDGLSIKVCQSLMKRFFGAIVPDDHVVLGDFLSDGTRSSIATVCPADKAYILMNPPYGRIDKKRYGKYATVVCDDLYALFIERCLEYRGMSAIVPQSFTTSAKFAPLRVMMASAWSGDIVTFDNVPSPVFCGRKRGITNTNKSNSVRPAIMSVSCFQPSNDDRQGETRCLRLSPILRFGVSQRHIAISDDTMALAETGRAVSMDEAERYFPKVPAPLAACYEWLSRQRRISACCAKHDGNVRPVGTLWIPATPRYRTCASTRKLNRSSVIAIDFVDIDDMMIAYLVFNSSLAYSWWRFHDGGITLTKGLCFDIPVPPKDALDMHAVCSSYNALVSSEHDALRTKVNAGKINESLDFGQDVIDRNTKLLLGNMGDDAVYEAFRAMHSPDITEQIRHFA